MPYPPGDSSDMLARLMVPGLTQRLATTIVVENKTGAAGNIGTAAVATSSGDGCTWLLGNSTNVVICRNLYKLPRDSIEALVPVGYDAPRYQRFVKTEDPLWESLVKQMSAKVDLRELSPNPTTY